MSGATSTVKRVAATTVGLCVKASFGNKTENGSSRLLRSLDELNPALDQPLGFTMCYMTVISTTSEVDLTLLNTPLMQFSRSISGVPEAELLQYPQKWFLGSKDGCSCDFRHLDRGSADLGFSQPVDWWPEDQEDIDATLQVLEVFRSILAGGHDLDCIDAWCNDKKEPPTILVGEISVNLQEMEASSFRFFEGYRFEFVAGA